ANPGTLIPTDDLMSATLVAGNVGAHCDKGLLITDGKIPPLGPFVLPGNNYHVYDYALFWGAIRRDAERRVAAWRGRLTPKAMKWRRAHPLWVEFAVVS